MSFDAQKVLIRGHIFDYEEKAPFVTSGVSVLGAIEYDPEAEKVKCHECGEWFNFISRTHLLARHNLTSDEYKIRHGINLTSGLCTPRFSKMRSTQNPHAGSPEQTARLVEAGREHKRVHGNNLRNRTAQRERSNAVGRCKAQTLFRIQLLAAELKRTPTVKELVANGFDQPLLVKHFGGADKALKEAGLNPRPYGKRTFHIEYGQLPEGFPTKEQLQENRMPWPKEYFGIRHLERPVARDFEPF